MVATVYINTHIWPTNSAQQNQNKPSQTLQNYLYLSLRMSSSQVLQGLLALPARSRQLFGSWRNRVTSGGMRTQPYLSVFLNHPTQDWSHKIVKTEKAKPEGRILRRSLQFHRPVWATGGTAMYTTAGAVYLTLRCLRKLRWGLWYSTDGTGLLLYAFLWYLNSIGDEHSAGLNAFWWIHDMKHR